MIPKASPDCNRHILMRIIGLDLSPVPRLGRRAEDPFPVFSLPPFHRTLVTPHGHPPLFVGHALCRRHHASLAAACSSVKGGEGKRVDALLRVSAYSYDLVL
jgi:hypothetical protein